MELDKYEFEEIGEWRRHDRIKSGIDFYISKFRDDRVIYAFVVDEEVKYIGICEEDTTILSERLDRYKYLCGASTNKRIAGKIRRCLEKGEDVKIHGLKPELKCEYKDLEVDLVKGLENPLIKKFKPEWNLRK